MFVFMVQTGIGTTGVTSIVVSLPVIADDVSLPRLIAALRYDDVWRFFFFLTILDLI